MREAAARRGFVERLADVDTACAQLRARSFDVGNDQIQVVHRAGLRRRDVRPELDRRVRAWRCYLDDAKLVATRDVGVGSPAELVGIERLRAIGVGNGDDDDFELEVFDGVTGVHREVRGELRSAHDDLLRDPWTAVRTPSHTDDPGSNRERAARGRTLASL